MTGRNDIHQDHQVIANEGNALAPLFNAVTRLSVTNEFRQQAEQAVRKMSSYYPFYLTSDSAQREELTEMEDRILQLMCDGKNTEEICEICFISYNTLKFHNKNIYRKLGAKNRNEAEHIARKSGMYQNKL